MRTYILNFMAADQGGALTYVVNFCHQLARVGMGARFVVLLNPMTYEAVQPFPRPDWVEYRVCEWPKTSLVHRLYFDQFTVRRVARAERACGLYSQLFATARFGPRQVLNLRNRIYFSDAYQSRAHNTQSARRAFGFALKKQWTRFSIQQADVVVAPTRAMLEDARAWQRRSQLWTVVHHGFDRAKFFGGRSLNPMQQAVLDSVPAHVPRILFVSGFCEQKNVDTLFKGFSAYRGRGNEGKLLLTFRKTVLSHTGAERARKAFGLLPFKDDVLFLGRVKWEEISSLYLQCHAFAFPSYLESFGHPLVEAMASGLPIVASDTPVNREICRDAALYFETFSPHDLAHKLEVILNDHGTRQQLRDRGRKRSTAFSWERHVHEIVSLLEGAH